MFNINVYYTFIYWFFLVIALLFPVPVIVIILTKKEYDFIFFALPPTLCYSKNVDVVYYSIIFVINVIIFIGLPMLLYLLWTLHKVN